jgi:hypothetical protein
MSSYEDDLYYEDNDESRAVRMERVLNLLQERQDALTLKKVTEEELRAKFPALAEAWEQYQIILRMVQ